MPTQWAYSKVVKLKYIDTDTNSLTFNGTTTIQPSHIYKINSAYDVNAAIASTDMPGFQEVAAMYGFYRVLACKITTQFYLDANNGQALNCGIIMVPQVLPGYTQAEFQHLIRANPANCKTRMAIPYMRGFTVTMYKKLKNLHGNPIEWKGNDNYSAPIGANPASLMYGYVFASGADSSVIVPACKVLTKTEVTMYIKFFKKDLEIN